MKALVYHGPGKKSWDDVPDAAIQDPTDVVVHVDTTTICGTDLHILAGDVPAVTEGRILGHEAVGTITAVGDAISSFKVGDRVLVPAITRCGRCEYCQRNMPSHCQTVGGIGWIFGHLIDGTQAESVRVPYADTSLYHLPEGVSDEKAIFLADSLPTGYEVGVLAGGVRPGDTIAVVGAGAVGLAAILTTGLWGAARVIAVDSNKFRLEKAVDFGATDTVEVGPNTVADVLALTDGLGVDVAIEAVGYPETLLTYGRHGPAGRHGGQHRGPRRPRRVADAGAVDPEHQHHHGTGRHRVDPHAAQDGRERQDPQREDGHTHLHLRPDGRGLRRLQERRGQPGPQGRHPARLIVATYRFLDAMGQVVAQKDFEAHASAIAWATEGDDELEEEVQRVEYLGPEGDWRWAGPLLG